MTTGMTTGGGHRPPAHKRRRETPLGPEARANLASAANNVARDLKHESVAKAADELREDREAYNDMRAACDPMGAGHYAWVERCKPVLPINNIYLSEGEVKRLIAGVMSLGTCDEGEALIDKLIAKGRMKKRRKKA
jgi:hypothetical protein